MTEKSTAAALRLLSPVNMPSFLALFARPRKEAADLIIRVLRNEVVVSALKENGLV